MFLNLKVWNMRFLRGLRRSKILVEILKQVFDMLGR